MIKTNSDSQAEARHILERLAREAEPGSPAGRRFPGRPESASTAEKDDWIERWGTRIGRGLAAAFSIGVIGWALLFLVRR